MNTLILSMPRTLSTLLFTSIVKTSRHIESFYEPGLGENWGELSPHNAAILSEAALNRVDESLKSPLATVVKILPAGPYYQLNPGRLVNWSHAFDEVIVLDRNFYEIAKSFIIAYKTRVFVVRGDNRIPEGTSVTYNSDTDMPLLWELAYGRKNLDYWIEVLTQKNDDGKPKLVTRLSYDEVIPYMNRNKLDTSATEKQRSVTFLNESEFISDLASVTQMYEVKL